jgi:hypothetical protein
MALLTTALRLRREARESARGMTTPGSARARRRGRTPGSARARRRAAGCAVATITGLVAAAPAPAAVPFSSPFGYAAGAVPMAVATGDLNGDGRPDVVSADSVCTQPVPYIAGYCVNDPGLVWVRLAGPLGTLGAARSFTVGADPFAVALGNFNGHAGIATANFLDRSVSVLLGDGHGNFGAASSYPTANLPVTLVTGDFNGDGKADFAVADTGEVITFYYGDGHGGFSAPVTYPLGTQINSLAVGDLNHDGRDDLVVAQTIPPPGVFGNSTGDVTVLYGASAGGVAGRTDLTTDSPLDQVAVADLNGDGNPDIVTVASGHAWLGNGHGGFSAPTSFSAAVGGGYASSLAVSDFDGDGHPDLAFGGSDGNVWVALGDGRGNFGAPTATATGANPLRGVAAADFVGDGRPDIAAVNGPGSNGGGYVFNGPVGLGILYNLTPPSWWPSWAAGAWPSVLAQWASAQWPSSLHPWDINAWVPQPAINTWSSLTGGFGFSADAASRHARRTTPAWLRRLGARRIPAWLTPRTVSRWAAAAEHRAAHRRAALRRGVEKRRRGAT